MTRLGHRRRHAGDRVRRHRRDDRRPSRGDAADARPLGGAARRRSQRLVRAARDRLGRAGPGTGTVHARRRGPTHVSPPPTRPVLSPRPAAWCSTPARRSGSPARWRPSIRDPATSPVRATRPGRACSARTAASAPWLSCATHFRSLGRRRRGGGGHLLRFGRQHVRQRDRDGARRPRPGAHLRRELVGVVRRSGPARAGGRVSTALDPGADHVPAATAATAHDRTRCAARDAVHPQAPPPRRHRVVRRRVPRRTSSRSPAGSRSSG